MKKVRFQILVPVNRLTGHINDYVSRFLTSQFGGFTQFTGGITGYWQPPGGVLYADSHVMFVVDCDDNDGNRAAMKNFRGVLEGLTHEQQIYITAQPVEEI